jgi:hypothetical protein
VPISKIEKYFRETAAHRQWISVAAATYLRLVFPAFLALLITYRADLGSAFWPAVILLSAVQVLSVIVRAVSGKNEQAFFEYLDLERSHEAVEERLTDEEERAMTAIYAIQALRYASLLVTEVIERFPSHIEEESLVDLLRRALSTTIELRSIIFGFEDALYSFAVYRYNPEKNRLEVIFRDTHRDIPIQNRSWKPGRGHVGFCFIRRDAVLSSDIRDSEELSDDQSPTDDQYYVSILAAPILQPDGQPGSDPWGVIVVTSNRVNEFMNEIHQPFAIALANLMSVLVDVASRARLPLESPDAPDPKSHVHPPKQTTLTERLKNVVLRLLE